MRPHLPTLLFALALPCAAAAQTVEGRLVSAADSSAVPAARVQLVAGDDARVGEAVSGVDGRFTLAAPEPGTYRIVATPAGGAAVAFGPFALAAGQRKGVLLRMPRGTEDDGVVALAPVTAVGQPRVAVLERHGFYERQRVHYGRFLTHDDLARLPGTTVLDHVRGLGIFVEPAGANRFSLYRLSHGGHCYLAVFVDGLQSSNTVLSRLSMDEVAGVEYYRGDDLPLEFNPYYGRSEWNCGAVVIWTRAADDGG